VILKNFPTQDVWLKVENSDDWSNFVDEFVAKTKSKH
jgi:hypothetical protein